MAGKRMISIWLRMDQINRLNLLRSALSEKMGKDYSLGELLEKVIDDFLGTK